MGPIGQRGSWVLLWWAIVRLVGGGGDWFSSVWIWGKAIILPVVCGEKDNLESSTATGLHKGEHMGRMRMETHEYCADVGGGSGEEKSIHMVY